MLNVKQWSCKYQFLNSFGLTRPANRTLVYRLRGERLSRFPSYLNPLILTMVFDYFVLVEKLYFRLFAELWLSVWAGPIPVSLHCVGPGKCSFLWNNHDGRVVTFWKILSSKFLNLTPSDMEIQYAHYTVCYATGLSHLCGTIVEVN